MVYNLTHAVQEFQIQKSKEGFERTVLLDIIDSFSSLE